MLRLLAVIGLAFLASNARAELTVAPLRQVIAADTPVATYRVSNGSNRIVDGRVRWVDLRATETGYEPADPALRERLSAAPFLTVQPASFRLEPGSVTLVTVRLKPGAAAPKGERRSHLLFEIDATRTPLRRASAGLEADVGLGLSTPVLLRGGPVRAAASIGETRLLRAPDGRLEIETHVRAESGWSAYGALDFVMREPSRPPRRLARIENVAAYIDAPRRKAATTFDAPFLPAGALEILYVGRAEFEGVVFARRAFEIEAPKPE